MGRSLRALSRYRHANAPPPHAKVRHASGCPFASRHRSQVATAAAVDSEMFTNARPYSEVPGPKPIPILGNTWRLVPVVGQFDISELAKVSRMFLERYGRIVRLGGLVGRPDLLFVFDADEIERMYRREGPTPFRPSMPCLVKYKSEVRKDFFGELPGVVGV
ncbi:Probable cytochrome P450 301a1, mitochondrial [Eumeta japonica]|uniref:Probable cytochrome P450 301a1, mitochondrial n=1 Tax=Eumeta variegata TaxID=151549 RepID=A0A4C1XFR5_EUMVA|nr:Probable cytochrome P450 301a1, mitochondrial [Eumeta japonica]